MHCTKEPEYAYRAEIVYVPKSSLTSDYCSNLEKTQTLCVYFFSLITKHIRENPFHFTYKRDLQLHLNAMGMKKAG